jgi:hypothetical protein
MKTLVAALLAALPLAALPDDPAPAKGIEKMAVPEELYNQAEAKAAPQKAEQAKPAETKTTPKEGEKKAPATAAAKPAARDAKAAPKKDEKPCEPVKPCSID